VRTVRLVKRRDVCVVYCVHVAKWVYIVRTAF